MTVFVIIMRMLGAAASLYMLLIMARIILTWFPTAMGGRSMDLLASATDPYLNIFRRISFLRSETLDFSPVAALAVLSVAMQIFTAAANFGHVTVGLVLALVFRAAWSFFSFFFSFFGIAMTARMLAYLARWNSLHPVWRVVDALINPVLFRLNRRIYKNRIVNFRQGLLTGMIVFLGLWFLGGRLVDLAVGLLLRIPF